MLKRIAIDGLYIEMMDGTVLTPRATERGKVTNTSTLRDELQVQYTRGPLPMNVWYGRTSKGTPIFGVGDEPDWAAIEADEQEASRG